MQTAAADGSAQEKQLTAAATYDQVEATNTHSKTGKIFFFLFVSLGIFFMIIAMVHSIKRRRDKLQLDELTSALGRNNEFSEDESEEDEFAMYEMTKKGTESLKAKMEFV